MDTLIPFISLPSGGLLAVWAPLFLAVGYATIVFERYKNGGDADPQATFKLVLYFIFLLGFGFAVEGVAKFAHYLLSGTKAGSGEIKQGIASFISGGLVVFGVLALFLPRTNALEMPRLRRLVTGYVLVVASVSAVTGLHTFLSSLIQNRAWTQTSGALVLAMVYGALAFFALQRFGQIAGWRAPPPRAVSVVDNREFGGPQPYQQGYSTPAPGFGPPPAQRPGPAPGPTQGAAPPPAKPKGPGQS